MKIVDVTIDKTVEKRDRNQSIGIDCSLELGDNFRINVTREVILIKDGKVYTTDGQNGECVYQVSRRLFDIAMDTVTLPPELGGITINAAQMAKALEMFTDKYAQEDHPD